MAEIRSRSQSLRIQAQSFIERFTVAISFDKGMLACLLKIRQQWNYQKIISISKVNLCFIIAIDNLLERPIAFLADTLCVHQKLIFLYLKQGS